MSPDDIDLSKLRKRLKSERRRSEILEHAQRLFQLNGYSVTTLDEIAQAVGIKREGLYYYFKNRRDILHALVIPILQDLNKTIAIIATSEISPQAKLYAAIRNHLYFDMNSLGMVVLTGHGDDLQESKDFDLNLRPYYKSYEKKLAQIIDEGRTLGLFDKKSETKIIVYAILGMCNWMFRWYDPNKTLLLSEIADTFFLLTARGLVSESIDIPSIHQETDAILADLHSE